MKPCHMTYRAAWHTSPGNAERMLKFKAQVETTWHQPSPHLCQQGGVERSEAVNRAQHWITSSNQHPIGMCNWQSTLRSTWGVA